MKHKRKKSKISFKSGQSHSLVAGGDSSGGVSCSHVDNSTVETCLNCGEHFSGLYCPNCGQSAKMKRITWSSVFAGAADVWGLGNRSMPLNVKHLFTRPGHMIYDYLQGCRQRYFPPFKMMFLLVALVVLLKHLSGDEFMASLNDGEIDKIDDSAYAFMSFIHDHRAFFALGVSILMAGFLRLFFAKSPRLGRINLCESVMVQVWAINQVLLVSVIKNFFVFVTGVDIPYFQWALVLCLWADYKQLFGMNWFATLWRTILLIVFTYCVFIAIILLLAVIL